MEQSGVVVDVLTATGSNTRVEFRVKRDTVELRHHERLAAVFDRERLHQWLHEPDDDMQIDEARLSVDWLVDTSGRIALTLPDVDGWTLAPAELDELYRRIVGTQR
jgi:hypothetical protein